MLHLFKASMVSMILRTDRFVEGSRFSPWSLDLPHEVKRHAQYSLFDQEGRVLCTRTANNMPYSYIIFAYSVASAYRGRKLVLGSWASESGKTYDPSSQVIKQEEVTPLTITISKHAPHHIPGHLGHITCIMWQTNMIEEAWRQFADIRPVDQLKSQPTCILVALHQCARQIYTYTNMYVHVHVNYTTQEDTRNHRNQCTCSQQILLIGVAIIHAVDTDNRRICSTRGLYQRFISKHWFRNTLWDLCYFYNFCMKMTMMTVYIWDKK